MCIKYLVNAVLSQFQIRHYLRFFFSCQICIPKISEFTKKWFCPRLLLTFSNSINCHPLLDTRISVCMSLSVTLRIQHLDSEMGWTEKLWLQADFLNGKNYFYIQKNKPATQAADADPSRYNSNNRQNPPVQQNHHNF